jgi:hypothetical protein
VPGAPHVRIVMSGIFGGSTAPYEIWSMSMAVDNFAGAFDDTNAVQVGLTNALSTWFSDPVLGVTSQAKMLEVAFSSVGANGRQVGNTSRQQVTQVQGGGGAVNMPPQVACRVSTGSGERGRSQKGGFYLPTVRADLNTITGLMEETRAQQICDVTAAMFGQVNSISTGRVVIPSTVAGNVRVNQVRVGRALDTIRRRRNNLNEGYTLTPLP